MRLVLLRHAQSGSNVSGALDTAAPGAELTALGRAQAAAAATALADRGVQAIYCSNLRRTAQTAAPLAESLDLAPVVLDGLREISAGVHEMRTDEESRRAYLRGVATWLGGDLSTRMDGGETGTEFLDRYDAAIDRVVSDGTTTTLVVSHGAAIRTWVGARAAAEDRWADLMLEPLRNTGCIELDGGPGTWRIVAWEVDPIGGDLLADPGAADPTGDPPVADQS